MNLEFTDLELALLDVLLQKELGDTRVEIHHSKNHDYKTFLVDREKVVGDLIKKLEKPPN